MKKLSYLILSLFILMTASCSSDDDNGPVEASILGKWDITQMIMEGTFTEEGATVSFNGVANSLPGNDITFNADNTSTSNSAPFNMDLTYVIEGETYTMTQQVSSELTTSGTWREDGNFLYLKETGSNDEVQYKIVTLNSSTLKLTADQNNINMGADFPADGQFMVTITMSR